MFEVWQNHQDPTQRLVFRESTSFPGAFAVQDWTLLGMCQVATDISDDVDQQGFVMIRSNLPFDPSGILGTN